MSNSNGVISAPVSIDDVKTVLGESSNDLATLCQSSNINKWTRYKPVDWDAVAIDIKSNWSGKGGHCNWSFPTTTSLSGIPAFYSKTNNGWSYSTVSAPYRLGDFNGYDSNATTPISIYCPTPVEPSKFYASIYDNLDGGTQLSINDVIGSGTWYFGIALYNTSNNLSYFKTVTTPNNNETISFKTLAVGGYTVYPFISSTQYPNDSNTEVNGTTYIPFPIITPPYVSVKTVYVNPITYSYDSTNKSLTVTNNSTSAHTVRIDLIFADSDPTDSLQSGEYTLYNSSLASKASKTVSFKSYMASGKSYDYALFIDGSIYTTNTIN